MDVALHRGMTLEEFLVWDESQAERWEFDGFAPVAMVGGTSAHATICLNLGGELRNRLRGGPCRAYVEGMQIKPAGRVRYPDALVVCGPVGNEATSVDDPVVVFEVLSPGTVSTDFVAKNAEYRSMPSIQRYVILTQDRVSATVFERRGDEWVGRLVTDIGAALDMPEIGVSLPLAALYEGLFEE